LGWREDGGHDVRRILPYALASPPLSGPVETEPTVGRAYTFQQGAN
jgi:hypothetical protein